MNETETPPKPEALPPVPGSACRPIHGQKCVIHHRGELMLSEWDDNQCGGSGAWYFHRNGAWLAVPSQVTRWWPIKDESAFLPPNTRPSGH